MDEDEDLNPMAMLSMDPVVDRGDALIRLAQAAELSRDLEVRTRLLAYMSVVHNSIAIPMTMRRASMQRVVEAREQGDNVVPFPGPEREQ